MTDKVMKIGDKIPTWFSGEKDGMSTIVEITPYPANSKVRQLGFDCVLTLTAPNTRKRTIEMSYNSSDFINEGISI